jgi:hypothetical protein
VEEHESNMRSTAVLHGEIQRFPLDDVQHPADLDSRHDCRQSQEQKHEYFTRPYRETHENETETERERDAPIQASERRP